MSVVNVYTPAATGAFQFANPISMVRNLWTHRELIRQFSWREVTNRYQGSHLGLVWSLLNPLMMLGVYTFVFSVILKVKWPIMVSDSRAEFALILFTGLILNSIFVECAGRAPTLVVSQPNFVKKVVFPLEILPVVAVGSALITTLITLVLLAFIAGIFLNSFYPTQLLIAVVMLPAIFLSLGAGWLLSAMGVFLRDIGHFIPVFLQILTFTTPVFFPLTAVPEKYRWIVQLHPMTSVVEGARSVLIWRQYPDWNSWLISLGVSLIVMQLGYIVFMKSKRAFADVI